MRRTLLYPIHQAVRRAGLENLACLALIYLAIACLVYGLSSAMQGLDVWPLLVFGFAGLVLGWLLAGTALHGWAAAAISLAAAGIASLLILGRLAIPLGALARAELLWVWQLLRLKRPDLESFASLDNQPILQAWQGLKLGVNNLFERSETWAQALVNGHPTYDPLVILLALVIIVWLVAAWAGWWIRGKEEHRERVLIGLLPSGVILVGTVAYSGAPVYPIAIWLAALIAVQALGDYIKQIHHWRCNHVDKAEIELEWSFAVIAIIACLVTFSLAAPSLSVSKISGAVRQALNPAEQQEVVRALGLRDPRPLATTVLDGVQNPGLPTRHLLGAGPELSEKIVMRVGLAGYQPAAAGLESIYWRSLTYDRYTGGGWSATPTSRENFPAGASLQQQLMTIHTAPYLTLQPQFEMANPLSQLSQSKDQSAPTRLLYYTGELLGASQPYQVAWRNPGDIFGVSIMTDTYSVETRLVRPSEAQLRLAGQDYPEEIRRVYLGLPESIPRRVWDLAQKLTVAEPTAYDQAQAIQEYLRTYPYTLELTAPPPGRDVVDYFLFDLKRGYCDYYASAMVVLARAAGLPARLVIGYGSGTYRPTEERFLVTEADAHAWTEIYFPGYGWVEFEPTASRPVFWRPVTPEQEALTGAVATAAGPGPAALSSAWRQLSWLVAFLAGIILLILLWQTLDRLRLGMLPAEHLIRILYRRLYRQAENLGDNFAGSLTPAEFAALLSQQLEPNQFDRLPAHIQSLTGRYAESVYSTHGLGSAEKHSMLESWRVIRQGLWRLRLARTLRALIPHQKGQP